MCARQRTGSSGTRLACRCCPQVPVPLIAAQTHPISDALLSTTPPDWTHAGITHLFSAIKSNHYNFLFLSSRSIAQVDLAS